MPRRRKSRYANLGKPTDVGLYEKRERQNFGEELDIRSVVRALRKAGHRVRFFEDNSLMVDGVLFEEYHWNETNRLAYDLEHAVLWFGNSITMANSKRKVEAANYRYFRKEKEAKVAAKKKKKSKQDKVKAKAKAKKAENAEKIKALNTGHTLGMRVEQTWVHVFKNVHKTKMTDEQITAFMLEEFAPKTSKVFSQVPQVRSKYNRGLFKKYQEEAPKRRAERYDEDGNVMAARQRKSKKDAEPEPEKKKGKKKGGKKKGKKGKKKAKLPGPDED
jgi:hypothetical protein